jgi:dimethylsulfone monooxygenase
MRYGYWMPVFGGWLRNVADEQMEASWDYTKKLAIRSEKLGYDLTLVAELFLNDIKGIDAPSLDAWSTAAALAAVTEKLELMVAVRPTFHLPAIFAKQAANIDQISGGRLSLNLVSSWWKDEARRFGVRFDEHDDRYARTEEWLGIVDRAWRDHQLSHEGKYYTVDETIVEPKPVARGARRRPTVWAGGESEAAKTLIARDCDAYVMHGDPPERIAPKVADLKKRREAFAKPPMQYGMAAYAIVRDSDAEVKKELDRITNVAEGTPGYGNYRDWIANTKLEQQVSLEDYSVSNRGLRAGLAGTPEQVAERVRELEAVGVNLLLLQCSPQLEEMERFAEQVMPLVAESRLASPAAT